MSTEQGSPGRAGDLLERMRQAALDRFELELNDMRTSMAAISACCEQSLHRLRDARWVPFDAVCRLVSDLSAAADLERSRSARLAEELEATRRELDEVRTAARSSAIGRDRRVRDESAVTPRGERDAEPAKSPVDLEEITCRSKSGRSHLVPEFSAIEAAIAGSPPVGSS